MLRDLHCAAPRGVLREVQGRGRRYVVAADLRNKVANGRQVFGSRRGVRPTDARGLTPKAGPYTPRYIATPDKSGYGGQIGGLHCPGGRAPESWPRELAAWMAAVKTPRSS
jgi:hypothetical protein